MDKSSEQLAGGTDAMTLLAEPTDGLDESFLTYDHWITTRDGSRLHAVEKHCERALTRRPRRAVLMLPGTLVTNAMYAADSGDPRAYSAMEYVASHDFFVFAPSYEGYGQSSQPEDGRAVTLERLLAHVSEMVTWICAYRDVERVDVVGCSLGAALAMAMGSADSPILSRIGRLVLTSMVYKEVSPMSRQMMLSPEARQLLAGAPSGYVQTVPAMYEPILMGADPAVSTWALQQFPGRYAVGPTMTGFELPLFAAATARAPALQVWCEQDPITPRSDVERLQQEYGGAIRLLVLPGGHAPAFGPGRRTMWQEVVAFLSDLDAVSN